MLIALLLMLGAAVMPLQAQQYLFSNFNKNNSSLPYDSVREIYQDSRGYVWIGTYKGLSRYDGTRFRNYDRQDLKVSSDFINVINEDSEGNLWLGTDNGVVIYDYKKDEFRTLAQMCPGQVCPDDRIFDIALNSKGVVWVSSRRMGLFSYRPSDKSVSHHPLSGDGGEPVTGIYRITVDKNDNLYLAVYCENILFADDSGSGYVPMDLGVRSDYFVGDDVADIVMDSKSNDILYIASKRNGLVEVDVRKKSVKTLYRLQRDERPIALMANNSKELWLSTTNGAVRYDFYTREAIMLSSDPDDPFSLSDNYITKIYVDRKNGLWIGTQYGGLDYCGEFQNNFRKFYRLSDGTSLAGCIVRDIEEDRKGNLWIATERMGLLRYVPAKDKLVCFGGGTPKNITALCDDEDCLWIGSQKGISRLDYATSSVRYYYPFEAEDRDNRVVTIYRSNSGDIYVATTIGVLRYSRQADMFEMLPEFDGLTVESLAEDSRGILWLATYSEGVYTYDFEKEELISHYSPQSGSDKIPDMISSICIDDRGCPWVVGFSSGFFRYDRDRSDFITYDMQSLPSLPSDVYFMALPDDFGNLWLSSDTGLVEFDMDKNAIRVFSFADGLLDKEFTKSALQTRNGMMAFGSANGFIVFNPRDLRNADALSNVTITDMFLDMESVPEERKAGFYEGNIDLTPEITLSWRDNSFGFAFAVLESAFPASDKIMCLLDGYDKGWRDISVSKTAHWSDVPAGTYRLFVSNGEFSGYYKDAHEPIRIVVKPTFWASPLGIIIIIVLTVLLVWGIVWTFLRYQKAQEKRRMEEYDKRTEKEMLHDKMTFFSNIIHEIKTPLTLIRTPLMKIMSSGMCDESVRDDLQVISNSTDYMDHLVKELLEFVRLEEHGYVLDQKNVDIVERVGFLCSNFSESAKDKNIRLKYTHEQDNIVTAVDKSAFRKIINNLLDNAIKYAESYIKVNVSLQGGAVMITVRNDGPAIPKARRESIFKPFVQYSADKASYSQSFGIGLAFARTLTELHGGTLTLSDDPSSTEFVLSLPVVSVQKTPQYSEPEAEVVKKSGQPMILLVEDNASLLSYLRKHLKQDYCVVSAASAEKALELLEKHKVDIILTDIALQGMSGIDLCQKVNSEPELSHIPVIILSAISSVETKIRCMENGATMYIEKPFSIDYLVSCIKGALEKRATMKIAFSGTSAGGSGHQQLNLLNRDEDFLNRLENVVKENLGNPSFSNKQLEQLLFMSHSTLNRKVKTLLDTTPNDYIRTKRLAMAAEMLAVGGHRVNEVCYAVGFNSPSYFAKCFKSIYGKQPAEWTKADQEQKQQTDL